MKTIHTILREDFGQVDRDMVRTELLGQTGIRDVHCAPARNGLVIEYDAGIVDHQKLLEIMCRAGVFPCNPQDENSGATNLGTVEDPWARHTPHRGDRP